MLFLQEWRASNARRRTGQLVFIRWRSKKSPSGVTLEKCRHGASSASAPPLDVTSDGWGRIIVSERFLRDRTASAFPFDSAGLTVTDVRARSTGKKSALTTAQHKKRITIFVSLLH